jgi:hypothetical protein
MLLRTARAALGRAGRPAWLPEQFVVPDQARRRHNPYLSLYALHCDRYGL